VGGTCDTSRWTGQTGYEYCRKFNDFRKALGAQILSLLSYVRTAGVQGLSPRLALGVARSSAGWSAGGRTAD